MDLSIFKNYDIRAIYPEQLDEDLAYRIGRASADFFQKGTLAVGRDMRLGSEAVQKGLERGLLDGGINVVDLGLVSTDMVYFAVGHYGYDGGIMVTASHNPAEYAGMKFCRQEAIPISLSTGLAEIRNILENGSFQVPPAKGQPSSADIMDDWIKHALSFVDLEALRPLKIVVDAGNGMAGKIVPPIAQKLPVEIIPLFFELDGSFPNHLANPLKPENIVDLQKEVLANQADLGMAFDGDADRVFLIDEKGQGIDGSIMTAMVAQSMLKKQPGSTILYNAVCGDMVPETILSGGGKPIRTQVGHSIIKQKMREHDALFAGEHSGHYYFRDNFYADSGLIAALIVMELISRQDRQVSEIVADFDKYPKSPEINSTVKDIPAKLDQIKEAYQDGQLDELDGLTIRYPDYWFSVRA
ncbi:MAG TPA: phosphomannomutase/phosphoglucomutase, partial [Candidatus Wirthbacteria bacterium]|nr:phosphomannomutase/phosphoglucomutase [Candidatus Wirthbacteria bacterium]